MIREYVGEVWVDSGQVMIVDPCYLGEWKDNEAFPNNPPDDTFNYSGACSKTVKSPFFGQIDHGAIVSGTAYGDGVYPVYANLGSDGTVESLTIDFVGPGDES